MSPFWIYIGCFALLAGIGILAAALDRHDGREPDCEPAPFNPYTDALYREYHGMNLAEWERVPHRHKVALRDAYHRHYWKK